MMNNVILFEGKTPCISHRLLAEKTNNRRLSVQNLITQNIDDFREFGQVLFKKEVRKDGRSDLDSPKTYFLNEQQAYLLLTYLRNTKIVRTFKKALIKEFFAMREELRDKNIEAIQQWAALDLYHDAERLYLELDELEKWSKQRKEKLKLFLDTFKRRFKLSKRDYPANISLCVGNMLKQID